MSQNCRGLNYSKKLKSILNAKNQKVKSKNYVLALQETFLVNDNDLKWYQNSNLRYAFTAAETAHSAGCITIFKETVRIVEKRDIDGSGHGHLVVVEGLGEGSTIVGNIYSPVRSQGLEQETFYEALGNIIDELELKYINHEPNLILLGDFNLPLESGMHLGRAEKIRALNLAEYFNSLGLVDCWKAQDNRVTLKTGGTQLDRIFYRLKGVYKEELQTDWTFTISDHCLLQLNLQKDKIKPSRRIVSLPTYPLNCKEDREYIDKGLNDFYSTINENWDPSTKLEFLKVGLRTVVGECKKQRNSKEKEELNNIQKDLERRMVYKNSISLQAIEQNREEIEALFAKCNSTLEKRSENLALKAKTKWFYEGEQSTKYFLNMLRKRNETTKINEIQTESRLTNDQNRIKTEVKIFYKNLYEQDIPINIANNYYQHKVTVRETEALKVSTTLTKEEIYQTLKTCKDSAPGPDGISYSYYEAFWKYFGSILTQVWNNSLETGVLPESHTRSILKLLPKEGKDLSKMTNWRPITVKL
jgi:hypothetical protein